MSNADRTTVQIAEESTFGTASASGSDYKKVRFTSESLTRDTSTTTSAVIRPDRQVEDVVRTSVGASCELAQEMDLSLTIERSILEASMGAASAGLITPTVFDQADGAQAFSLEVYDAGATPKHGLMRDTGADDLTGFGAGDWIRIEPPNNLAATVGSAAQGGVKGGGYFRVITTNAAYLELEGSKILADAALTGTTTIRDGVYEFENGLADRSFTIQKSFADVDSGEGMQGLGMTIESLSISVSPENIITKNISFQGQNASHLSGLTAGGSAASTAEILNAVDHVAGIYCKTGTTGQDATLTPLDGVTSFEINISNGLRARNEVGTLGAASFGQSAISVTGSMQVYYDATSSNIIEKLYEGFEDGALAIAFEAASVNEGVNWAAARNTTAALCLHMPRVKFMGATRTATGTGTDIIAELEFQAFVDATESATIQATYFG